MKKLICSVYFFILFTLGLTVDLQSMYNASTTIGYLDLDKGVIQTFSPDGRFCMEISFNDNGMSIYRIENETKNKQLVESLADILYGICGVSCTKSLQDNDLLFITVYNTLYGTEDVSGYSDRVIVYKFNTKNLQLSELYKAPLPDLSKIKKAYVFMDDYLIWETEYGRYSINLDFLLFNL